MMRDLNWDIQVSLNKGKQSTREGPQFTFLLLTKSQQPQQSLLMKSQQPQQRLLMKSQQPQQSLLTKNQQRQEITKTTTKKVGAKKSRNIMLLIPLMRLQRKRKSSLQQLIAKYLIGELGLNAPRSAVQATKGVTE